MSEPDLVLRGVAELPIEAPSAEFSSKLRAAAQAQLLPAKVHPAWSVAVAASVLVYLTWALLYTAQI